MATAASAAAIAIINMVKKIPSSLSGYKYLLNTTKLMFTLFNNNSTDMSMVIILRLVNNPYMPMKNNAVLINNICDTGIIRPPPNLPQRGRLFETGLYFLNLLSFNQFLNSLAPVRRWPSPLGKCLSRHCGIGMGPQ